MQGGRNQEQALDRMIQDKVRKELGYDLINPYKSVEEQAEMATKTDLDRTIFETERHQTASDMTFKINQLEKQRAVAERELKQRQAAEKQKEAKLQRDKQQSQPQKRPRRDDIRDDDSGESGDYSYSDRSGSYSSSNDEDSYSSSDQSYQRSSRRRDVKASDKGGQRGRNVLKVDSSSDDYSDYDDRYHRRGEKSSSRRDQESGSRFRQDREQKTGKHDQVQDLAKLVKDVELKEFQKICLRRRDLCKWIEHPDFQHGIKGAFLRVIYHKKQYVIGQIEGFKEGTEHYRVEQRDTKQIVTLKNGGKLKDFKLNLVSDGLVEETEFKALQRQNKQLDINQDFITKIKNQIRQASKFQKQMAEINKLVMKESLNKIKRGNYKGLNLTEIKISLLGEVAIAEQAIRELKDDGKSDGVQELYKRAGELKELQRKVNEALMSESVPEASRTDKCGARLKAKDELQEWLEKQEDLRKNPEKDGSNIFTYRNKKGGTRQQQDQDFAANLSLFNDVQLLRLKSQKSQSGQPTQANSFADDINKWSYFEKMERLKRKIKQIHQRMSSAEDSVDKVKSMIKPQDSNHITDGIQPVHPDWKQSRQAHQAKITKTEESAAVMSLADYLKA